MTLKPYDILFDACQNAGLRLEIGSSGAFGLPAKKAQALVLEVVEPGEKRQVLAHCAVQGTEHIHVTSERFREHLIEQKILTRKK